MASDTFAPREAGPAVGPLSVAETRLPHFGEYIFVYHGIHRESFESASDTRKIAPCLCHDSRYLAVNIGHIATIIVLPPKLPR